MKNVLYFIFLITVSVFSKTTNYDNSPLVLKANSQPIALENLIKSYLNLNTESTEAKEAFIFNATMFDKNIEELFDYAESHNIETIRLVGEQSNIWDDLRQALKLPPTKANKLIIFKKSRTLLASNDKLINHFKNRFKIGFITKKASV